jgi:hypothetical protein
MKETNFDKLLARYLQHETSTLETQRIEQLFEELKKRNVEFITSNGEELIYQEITQDKEANIDLLVEGMYEHWRTGNLDYILHAKT